MISENQTIVSKQYKRLKKKKKTTLNTSSQEAHNKMIILSLNFKKYPISITFLILKVGVPLKY